MSEARYNGLIDLLHAVEAWAEDWEPWGDEENGPTDDRSAGGWTLNDHANYDREIAILRALKVFDDSKRKPVREAK